MSARGEGNGCAKNCYQWSMVRSLPLASRSIGKWRLRGSYNQRQRDVPDRFPSPHCKTWEEKMRCLRSVTMVMALSLICTAVAPAALAAPEFVNGLALDGGMLDRSGGTDANNGRVGYFSDIYYDPARGHWSGLAARGPGGGSLHYETRVQRFRLKIDRATGAISGFKILKTVIFKDESHAPLDGIAPNPTNELGNAFDPEGFVVHPKSGHFLVSDEYG